MPYNYDTLMGGCPDESNAAKFFQNCGLLHTERFCHCGSQMRPNLKFDHYEPWQFMGEGVLILRNKHHNRDQHPLLPHIWHFGHYFEGVWYKG